MKPVHLALLIMALLSVVAGQAIAAAAPAIRPNIVMIFSDDHAFQAISAYGSKINKTPNLDRIAQQGMRFDVCVVNNSICGPSRAAILTGKYSHKNGFFRNGNRFDGSQQTFPKLLQQAGYQTAMIGKWHLETDPTGFDFWEILIGQGPYWNPPMIRNGQRINHEGYTTDIIGDLSLKWLKEQRDPEKPFMLFFQHKAPHRNWDPHPRHYTMFDDADIPEPDTLFDDYKNRASPARNQDMSIEKTMTAHDLKMVEPNNMTPEQLKLWKAYYDPIKEKFQADKLTGKELVRWKYQRYMKDYLRCVQAVDENVGRVLDYLDESGLSKNTIVIYSSDQGFYLGEHGWFDKRWMYEESLRTPLMVRWPGVVKPGSVNKDIVSNIDFAETFLEVAGAKIPSDMQGKSLVPVLKGQTPNDWRKSFYYHYYEFPGVHSVARHYGVRTDRYKLIHYYQTDEWELFDLKNDPQEMKSVYDDSSYSTVVTDLKQELTRLQKEVDDTGPHTAAPGDAKNKAPKKQPAGKGKGVKAHDLEMILTAAQEKPMVLDGTSGVQPKEKPAIGGRPFAIGASVKAAGDGVIFAQGGGSLGASLFIKNGLPHLAVRSDGDGDVTEIAGKEKIKASGWTHIAGVLDEKEVLRLFINGKEVAKEEGRAVARTPSEGVSIGEDADSFVGEYSANALKGELQHVRMYLGALSAKEMQAWLKGETTLSQTAAIVVPAIIAAPAPYRGAFGNGNDMTGTGDWWKQEPKQPWLNLKVERNKVIGFCLYTVHRNILKLTAQLYPLYPDETRDVRLEAQQEGGSWKQIATAKAHDMGWAATFRVENWDMTKNVKYRVLHGEMAAFEGLIRRDPIDKETITVASLSCNSSKDRGDRDSFVRNLKAQDPDLLFFAGDQVYDHRDHTAAWLNFGKQFGEIMRDRPTITIPDDHDVGHPNLWGENGKLSERGDGADGGYYMPVEYVKMVERCQTSHLPDAYDPTPIERGINVYYTSLTLGGIDFAILEDRKFKSGPDGKIPKMGPRPDHINDPQYDPASIDVKGLVLLGERQLKFIRAWAQDWTGSDIKCVLSQTIFCGGAHLHGSIKNRLHADLDSNGWPQAGRNEALRELRKAFAIHLAGDQHIATFIHQGVDDYRDSIYSFCSPAIVNTIYSRWWWPSEGAGKNRDPQSPLPFTGDYLDGFNNHVTMLAYANPETSQDAGAGYALVKFNRKTRTIMNECWSRFTDVTKPDAKQFAGWPITVDQLDNYGRKAVAYLPTLEFKGIANPVVQIVEEATGEIIYTLRISGNTFKPKVFSTGAHTIRIGTDKPGDKEFKGVKPSEKTMTIQW